VRVRENGPWYAHHHGQPWSPKEDKLLLKHTREAKRRKLRGYRAAQWIGRKHGRTVLAVMNRICILRVYKCRVRRK